MNRGGAAHSAVQKPQVPPETVWIVTFTAPYLAEWDYLGGRGTKEPYKEEPLESVLYFVGSVRSYYGHSWSF